MRLSSMSIYIICGYGIPKSIELDRNYSAYLTIVFNTVYAESAGRPAALIPCGGPTSCMPPFEGTEAGAIADHLRERIDRAGLAESSKDWRTFPEETSLSTLENLLFAKKVVAANHLEGEVVVFCEKTREARLQKTAERVFQDHPVRIAAIDFDTSKNRYLDPALIAKKEQEALEESLWTLERPERMQKHHELFEKKFEFLRERQRQGVSHVDAVTEWYTRGSELLRELMPDHPRLVSKD